MSKINVFVSFLYTDQVYIFLYLIHTFKKPVRDHMTLHYCCISTICHLTLFRILFRHYNLFIYVDIYQWVLVSPQKTSGPSPLVSVTFAFTACFIEAGVSLNRSIICNYYLEKIVQNKDKKSEKNRSGGSVHQLLIVYRSIYIIHVYQNM